MGGKNMASEGNIRMELGMKMARNSILQQMSNGNQTNMLFSPLSFRMALHMLASAATGRTLEQLLNALESKSIANLNEQSSLLMELIANKDIGPGPTISLVIGIWVNHQYPVKPSFKQLADDVYKAKAESVDFLNQAEKVANEINGWAKDTSKGLIDSLVSPSNFTENVIAILASAVYFNASWVTKFHWQLTGDLDFHLLNGETVKVPFMTQYHKRHFYQQFEGFQLLKMPYKSGPDRKKYAMYVFLPDKKDGLQEMVHKFHSDPTSFHENWDVELVELEKLWIPKLKFEYVWDVKERMKELGLDLVFDDEEAEITEMVETSDVVYVSKAIQKSYIEVNEDGTTAASITALCPEGCGRPLDNCPSFIADHPFLFMIKEDDSGIVLFVGAALNPFSDALNGNGEVEKRKMTLQPKRRRKGKSS